MKECENPHCQIKTMPEKIFLIHVRNTEACFEYYGPQKYEEMRKNARAETKKKSRDKSKEKMLSKQVSDTSGEVIIYNIFV